MASEASGKWYDLGLQMGISNRMLNEIGRNNSYNKAACFEQMLKEWLRSLTFDIRTVDSLAAALEHIQVGYPDIAKSIREEFGPSKDPLASLGTAVEVSGGIIIV